MSSSGQRPRIYARIRPETSGEEELFDSHDDTQLCLESKDGQQLTYNFDRVFPPDATQLDLLNALVSGPGGVLTALRSGYDATVFAYGQTGSGKTYSMEGGRNWAKDPEQRGLVPRLFELIFTDLAGDPDISQLQVTLSFTELYNESIRDLLQAKADLPVHQEPSGGFAPKGAMKAPCNNVDEAITIYLKGASARATESTNMNATSSRSHALLILDLNWMVVGRGRRHARLNLLDLAGSEGLVKTGNVVGSARAKEGIMINLSLLCLKRVVDCLAKANRPSHIPFRESKLTRLLQASLGGNNVLHILLALHNLRSNREESVDALRFASACARMRLAPKQNAMSQQMSDMPSIIKDQLSKIDNLEKENAELRQRVEERANLFKGLETLPVHSSALREELLNTESQIALAEERMRALVQRQEMLRAQAMQARDGDPAALDKLRSDLRTGTPPEEGEARADAGAPGSTPEALVRELAAVEEEMETELRGLAADLATLSSNKQDLEMQLRSTGTLLDGKRQSLEMIGEGEGGEADLPKLGAVEGVPSPEAEDTVESLRAELAAVRAQLAEAAEAKGAALAEVGEMGQKLDALLAERGELLAETLRQQQTLQRESEERAAESEQYSAQLAALKLEVRELQAGAHEHGQQMAALKAEKAAAVQREAEARAAAERAQAEAKAKGEAAEMAEAMVHQFREQTSQLRDSMQQLAAGLNAQQAAALEQHKAVQELQEGGEHRRASKAAGSKNESRIGSAGTRGDEKYSDDMEACSDDDDDDNDEQGLKVPRSLGLNASIRAEAADAALGMLDAQQKADELQLRLSEALARAALAEEGLKAAQAAAAESEAKRTAEVEAAWAQAAEAAAVHRKMEEAEERSAQTIAQLRADVQRERAELAKMAAARQAAAADREAKERAAKEQSDALREQLKEQLRAAEAAAAQAAKERDEALARAKNDRNASADNLKVPASRASLPSPDGGAPARGVRHSFADPLPEAFALPQLDVMLARTAEDAAVELAEEADAVLRSEVQRCVSDLPSVGSCNGLRALIEVSAQSRASTLRLFREVGGPGKLATMLHSSEASYVIPYVLDHEGTAHFLMAMQREADGGAAAWARLRALLVEASDLRSKVYAATAIAGLARSSHDARGELCAQDFGPALLQTLQWCRVQPVPPQEVQRHACTALAELLEGQEGLKLQLVDLGVLQLLLELLTTVPDVIRAAVTCIGRLAGGSEACSNELAQQGALPTLCSLLWDRQLLGNDAMIAELAALALANIASSSTSAYELLLARDDFNALRLELLGALGLAAGSRLAKEEPGSMSDYAGGKPFEYVGTSVCGRWEGASAAGAGIVFERGPDGRYSKSYDNALFCDNPQYSLTVSKDCDISITVWDVEEEARRKTNQSVELMISLLGLPQSDYAADGDADEELSEAFVQLCPADFTWVQDRPSYESFEIPEVGHASWACPSYWRTRKAVMRARVKAGVRYLLVPHTARPGGVTSYVVSVTSTEEIRLSPPLAPWKKLAAPPIPWPLGARATDGTRAADWRNAPQVSLVNTSGAPCNAVVVLACGRAAAISGGVPLQLLQLQVSHNSASGNRRYVDRLTRSVVLQSRRAAAYEGGAFSFVTMALQLGAFERTRLIVLGPQPRAESSGPHAEAQLQLALYCEDDCIEVPEPPAEWHGQTWLASPSELDKDGTCEVEIRSAEVTSAPAAAVLIAELLIDGRAASDGSGVTISLRAREGGTLIPGGALPSAESAASIMLPPNGASRKAVIRAVVNSSTTGSKASLRIHVCSAVPATMQCAVARMQEKPGLACIENDGLGTPQLAVSDAVVLTTPFADQPGGGTGSGSHGVDRKYDVAVVQRVAEQLVEQRDHLQRFVREQLKQEPPGALLDELRGRIHALERELAAVSRGAEPGAVRTGSAGVHIDANEESRSAMVNSRKTDFSRNRQASGLNGADVAAAKGELAPDVAAAKGELAPVRSPRGAPAPAKGMLGRNASSSALRKGTVQAPPLGPLKDAPRPVTADKSADRRRSGSSPPLSGSLDASSSSKACAIM